MLEISLVFCEVSLSLIWFGLFGIGGVYGFLLSAFAGVVDVFNWLIAGYDTINSEFFTFKTDLLGFETL